MVFSGRPSSACHACRATRLKCDRAQDGCTQCARKKKLCPGYTNPSQLRLRDETDRVIRKIQGAFVPKADLPGKLQGITPCSSFILNNIENQDSRVQALRNVYHQPGLSKIFSNCSEDAAIAYFMTSYIASSPFSEYLQDLYLEDERADDALSAAIYAASFATFALRTRDHKYLNKGRNKYSLALSRTNTALKDPKSAVLDRTLASVLLLGLFESTVFMGRASPVEWTMHMTGALRILQLRGLQQFKSNVAHQLFVHAANNIRTSCIQREMNVHDELLVLNKSSILFLGPGDPSNKFSAILDKTASIRAQIRNSSRLLETNNNDILQEVLNLDGEASGLMNDSENKLPFTIRPIEDTPSWAYLHTAYSYSSFRIAKFWNTIRMVRLFLNEIIWDITSNVLDQIRDSTTDTASHPESDRFTIFFSLRETSVKNSAEIATGVLTCIPYFIEPHPSGRRFSPAARTLAWPLYLLYKCPLCPPGARIYARDWLEELAKDLNLPQVVETANVNINSGSPDDWLHLYHLD